jgi:hypothetical protein
MVCHRLGSSEKYPPTGFLQPLSGFGSLMNSGTIIYGHSIHYEKWVAIP